MSAGHMSLARQQSDLPSSIGELYMFRVEISSCIAWNCLPTVTEQRQTGPAVHTYFHLSQRRC